MFLQKHLVAVGAAAATLVAAAAVMTGGATSSASAAATTATCAQVVLIGARGTDEGQGTGNLGNTWSSGGLGTEAQGVANYVTTHTSKTVRVVGLEYPATAPATIGQWAVELEYALVTGSISAAQMPGTVYGNSKLAGANALRAELNALASVCPSTETVLVGYSQGAHVIGDVIANSTQPQLSAAAKSHIRAVALEGDPSYRKGEPWDAAQTPMASNGLFARAVGQFSGFNGSARGTAGRVMSWCSTHDFFCQSDILDYPDSMTVHTTTYKDPAHDTAIGGWIVSKL